MDICIMEENRLRTLVLNEVSHEFSTTTRATERERVFRIIHISMSDCINGAVLFCMEKISDE